ncbi:hypothetical protein M9Y10_028646 [Tritrichomonas musculus]|uniref:Protein kinase domain-containing protein n=1 Tax=Tritrichomonas musculus TaxID=1915356 RepID=A0ABR2KLY3_9EUKA
MNKISEEFEEENNKICNFIQNGIQYELILPDSIAIINEINNNKELIEIPPNLQVGNHSYQIKKIAPFSLKNSKVKHLIFSNDNFIKSFNRDSLFSQTLQIIKFPNQLSELKPGWCNNTTKLTNIILDNNQHFVFEDDALYNSSKTILYFCSRSKNTFIVPSSVRIISSFAFEQCRSLEAIRFEDQSSLEEIQESSFAYSNIQAITIPKSVKKIEQFAFNHCKNLGEIKFEKNENLEKISFSAFSNSAITYVHLPDSVNFIGENAFQNCNKLTDVTVFHDGQLTISKAAFSFVNENFILNISENTKVKGDGLEKIEINCKINENQDDKELRIKENKIDKEKTNKLSLDDFVVQGLIGSGSFGKVYKVIQKQTNETFAAKISKEKIKDQKSQSFLDISREVDILSKINHPSVLKFIYFNSTNFKKKPKPVIITELASNGTLEDFINLEPNINWTDTRKLIVVYGIASAMLYLHSNHILHRDLKPENILMDKFLLPKLADFGLSKIDKDANKSVLGSIKGTPMYMSPEIWNQSEYSPKSDVYAFGMIMYEIYTSQKPFKGCSFYQIIALLKKGYRPSFEKEIPDSYRNLIEQCWQENPSDRPSFEQIVSELKNNPDFITDKIDCSEYYDYIDFIENFQFSFNETTTTKDFSLFTKVNIEGEIDTKILVDYKLKYFPFKEFIKLKNEESINLIKEAENDPQKQYIIADYLINGKFEFNRNVELGLKYLKISMNNGNIDSIIFYIRMLIQGEVIPSNHKKAKKLLDKNLLNDISAYSLLYGILYKKEGNYEKAADCFMEAIKEGNSEAMYEYGKMIHKKRINKDKVLVKKYYLMSSKKGYSLATYKYGCYIKYNDDSFEEGRDYIKKAAYLGNFKAIYDYACFLIEDKKYEEVLQILEEPIKQGHVFSMVTYAKILLSLRKDLNYEEKALRIFKKAADKGNIESIYFYGKYLRNRKQGIKYIRIAANNNYAPALSEYGYMLQHGIEVTANLEEAIEYYTKGVYMRDPDSLNYYGLLLQYGNGVPQSYENAKLFYEASISRGGVRAFYNYAYLHQHGLGVPVDYDIAIKYYKEAIDEGDPYSMNAYATMIRDGEGVPSDPEESVKYYKMAIDEGCTEAMTTYARMLQLGEDIPQDYEEAIKYYKMAIEKGDVEAMTYYAGMLRRGEGVPQNYEEAIKYYKMAIEKGDVEAMTYYAGMLRRGEGVPQNYEEAIKYYKLAIEKDDSDAMILYGSMFRKGEGVSQNYEEAIKYYKLAIEKDNTCAMILYGDMLFDGDEIAANIEEATKYYKMAIEKGDPDAMTLYAKRLHQGNGIPKNTEEAIKYFKMAIELDDSSAMNNYAYMLQHGEGVPVNYEEAFKYYKLAAEYGNEASMFHCGEMLEKGEGCEIDIESAIEYYRDADENGEMRAKEALIRLIGEE